MRGDHIVILGATALLFGSCGGETTPGPGFYESEDTGVFDDDGGGGESGGGSGGDSGGESGGDSGGGDSTDAGHPITPPSFPTYSGGACPDMVGGTTSDAGYNEGFLSSGESRSYRLIVPESYDGSEPVPLIMGWHWLNASSNSFVSKAEMESAAEEMGVIAIFPDDIDDAFLFNWPFFEGGAGADEELVYTQDLLACLDEQYEIDHDQVHGIGVSAGGLWVTYLSSTEVVDHFASIMSLSGGLGDAYGVWEMEFTPRERKFPAFVLNGGANDWLGLDFHAASERYVDALRQDGHFVVACEHDAGHDMPPMEAPVAGSTKFYALWQFMLDHPYDTHADDSPYLDSGLPETFPEWCWMAE